MKAAQHPLQSVLSIVLGLLVLYLVKDWDWALWLSLGIGTVGLLIPWVATQIDKGWMGLASLLGWIMPKVLLTILFFGFLFPIALLARFSRKKDPLCLDRPTGSVYQKRDKQFTKSSFEKPW